MSEDITNDWVEYFTKTENRRGFSWCVASYGKLPIGVNPEDERVKSILDIAQKERIEYTINGFVGVARESKGETE